MGALPMYRNRFPFSLVMFLFFIRYFCYIYSVVLLFKRLSLVKKKMSFFFFVNWPWWEMWLALWLWTIRPKPNYAWPCMIYTLQTEHFSSHTQFSFLTHKISGNISRSIFKKKKFSTPKIKKLHWKKNKKHFSKFSVWKKYFGYVKRNHPPKFGINFLGSIVIRAKKIIVEFSSHKNKYFFLYKKILWHIKYFVVFSHN
jgi:hypothetical protein